MNTFTISGMTCAGCASKVEATLKAVSPSATVTLEPPRAMIADGITVNALNEALAKVGKYRVSAEAATPDILSWIKTYYPLLLVMGLIALASFAGQNWMMSFMAGFFIVFGAFKLLDVQSFANAYARYDIIAKNFKPWGYAYPFIETALGFGFLFYYQMTLITWIALILSVIGAIGAVQAFSKKQTIQCACLGTAFQLPMSMVTIVENVGMAVMAAWMLFAPNMQMADMHDMSKMEQPASAENDSTKAFGAVMGTMMKSMMMTPSGIPDQDFVKGMIPHHQGAIDMAKVEKQFGKDPEMLKLADAIIGEQTSEITFMNNWLGRNKLTAADAVADSVKANTAAMDTMMKSMGAAYTGNADIDFAKGMIPHHQGAIDMAKVVLQYGKDAEIKKMAEGVVTAQTSEIAVMKQWLTVHAK